MDHELVKYFIDETNKKFERLEHKVDILLAFKWQIVGGSLMLSVLVSVAIQILFTR